MTQGTTLRARLRKCAWHGKMNSRRTSSEAKSCNNIHCVSSEDIERKLAGSVPPERAYALSRSEWTSLEFNKSGKQILACCANGLAVSIDGFDGGIARAFLSEIAPGATQSTTPLAACFTSDDKSVIVGNEDGTVSCYQADSGLLARRLRGHVSRVSAVACNPKYCQLATACTNTAVWVW